MPEGPEVQIIINGLNKWIVGKEIVDVCFNLKKSLVCENLSNKKFREALISRKIIGIERMGKRIVFKISDGVNMVLHLKMTGQIIFSKDKNIPLYHKCSIIFKDGEKIYLADRRSWARFLIFDDKKFSDFEKSLKLGPDVLPKNFTYKDFSGIFKKKAKPHIISLAKSPKVSCPPSLKLRRMPSVFVPTSKTDPLQRRAKIYSVLLDQKLISGLGNIYVNESLFEANVHPMRKADSLTEKEKLELFKSIKNITKKALRHGGTTFSDYRNFSGGKGSFQRFLKVYKKENAPCPNCGTLIKREKISGRSVFFCPKEQEI